MDQLYSFVEKSILEDSLVSGFYNELAEIEKKVSLPLTFLNWLFL